jgi:hypothetical protein
MPSMVAGVVWQIAYDAATQNIWIGYNNVWYTSAGANTGSPSAGTGQTATASGTVYPYFEAFNLVFNVNFGQRPFTYTPPSGFVALNTYNLSTPTIPNGAVYMAATTYTGTGATQVVTNTVNGTAMQPDWVWLKSRSVARDHRLMDTVRGINNILYSDLTIAEAAGSALSSVNSNGFTLNTTDNQNVSSETYIGWQWKANGTGGSNTSGSITSTVSANTTAGFSIATYTGNGTSGATVGHGLGVAPAMIIVKNRSGTNYWIVWQQSLTSIGWNLYLNATDAQQNDNQFQAKSSTTFTISNGASVNTNGSNYVAYVFAEIAGYSAFGSYTGNGSTDGPFVYLGFRPRFVMIKRTDSTENWQMYDSSRNTSNVVGEYLLANSSGAGATITVLDMLSNGFKIRVSSSNPGVNTNGGTYIYMCFAENPFKYANAR